jgi:hypothetical protein
MSLKRGDARLRRAMANASRGGVNSRAHPTPTLVSLASTLPLQGRVAPSVGMQSPRAPATVASNFDPESETLDADYKAFRKRAKDIPPAERVATQAKFDAAFARLHEHGDRKVCEFFRYWMICADKACHRKQACAGNATKCFERHWPVTPHHMRLWLVTACKAMNDGMSAEDACRAGDAEAARWTAHVARGDAELLERLRAREDAPSESDRVESDFLPSSGGGEEEHAPRERHRGPRVSVL